MSFLGPRDLCALGETCRALRLLPFDECLWQPLVFRRFAAAAVAAAAAAAAAATTAAAGGPVAATAAAARAPDVVSWRAEYRYMSECEATAAAYMRDMPMGRVGRAVAPSRMRLPRLSLHESRRAAAEAAAAAGAGPRGEELAGVPLRFGAGVVRPAVPLAHGVLAPVTELAARQGSAVWSALR